jgi:amino acid adenylation domain-containing protein
MVSYRELDERSRMLAGKIVPGQVVAVISRDRFDYVVGMLAVLRAGGIYLPLDSEAPRERNDFILADTGATVLLDNGEFTDGEITRQVPTTRYAGYLIYTSGTTGTPKGVFVPFEALSPHLDAVIARFGFTCEDVVLQLARPTVDVAIEQVLAALSAGACLVLPERGLLTPAELSGLISTESVTVANLSAGQFHEVVMALGDVGRRPRGSRRTASGIAGLRGLRLMISGSDTLYPAVAAAWHELTAVPLVNAYGPTEAVITSTAHNVADGVTADVVPIGTALGGRIARVLDERLRPCPSGAVGELYLGGPVLAAGYWGRLGLTAQRFVADPYAGMPGARMYRTGDLVRRADDGILEFAGRADQQVKIRGFRIEPGEVEQALASCPGVTGSVVVARENRLAAYVTGAPPDYGTIREFLAGRLPEHMIPASVTVLDAFPLTADGKVDRTTLPVPGAVTGPTATDSEGRPATTIGHLPPRTPAEQLIAAVWAEVLGVPEVGADDNFFHLGGDSLTAVRVVGRVFDVFGEVSPYTIFDAPTVVAFAAAVADAAVGERPPLTRAGQSRAPLSKFQRGLWVLDQWHQGAATYNVPWIFRFAGSADPELVQAALQAIVARHESLRTTFMLGEDGPEQVIHERITVPFTVLDVPAGRVDEFIAAAAAEPFDLETGPLMRALALRIPDAGLVLLLLIHHIVWDEGSLPVLENELRELYEALAERRPHRLPELPVQYADFSAWQYQDPTVAGQLEYWREHLRGASTTPVLRTDRTRPEVPAFRGSQHGFVMPAPVARAVREFARGEDVTPFMVLLAGLALTLHRRQGHRPPGETDLVIGTPVSGRGRPELSGLIGYFVNLLPLRVRVEPGASFRDLVRHVREVAVNGYRHQDAPFDEIISQFLKERRDDGTPLCQVVLELHPFDARPLSIGGTAVTRTLYSSDVSRFDLSISVDDRGTEFTGRFEYDSDLFDEATMTQLCDAWLDTLTASVETPAHGLFEAQAAQAPERTALIHGESKLTYAELNSRANQLARVLVTRGVGRGALVAILAERGFDLVIALLAVLKAGAGYTLLDADFPAERLAATVTDSGVTLVLTGVHAAPFARTEHLDLTAAIADMGGHPDYDLGLPVTGDDLACLMFTSGSTGRPKGVAVPHRALTTSYLGQDYARFGPRETWLQCAPVSWDAFALELYGALMFGGSCVLQPGKRPEPPAIAALTRQHGVTQLQLSASLFNFLLEEYPDTFADLRLAFTAGERASVPHVTKALDMFPDLRVINGYGPVESLGLTTYHQVGEDDLRGASIPIGRPVNGKDIYVLDHALRRAGPGRVGELYAAGGGLAHGYIGQPGLTAARFVASPFGRPGERLYRTGDLGFLTANGVLEITGRADDQIKIRGFRVEPGEIEDALTSHPLVQESAVAICESGDDRRLAAYIVAGSVVPDTGALLDHLAELLPEYMLPATIDVLDALPLTRNGKVDRRALPAPSRHRGATSGESGELSELESLVAGVMGEVLGVDRPGRNDNFFRLGGNSLAAVRVAIQLSRATGSRVPPHMVFRAKTVGAIAGQLAAL